jgi:hypothetical protein
VHETPENEVVVSVHHNGMMTAALHDEKLVASSDPIRRGGSRDERAVTSHAPASLHAPQQTAESLLQSSGAVASVGAAMSGGWAWLRNSVMTMSVADQLLLSLVSCAVGCLVMFIYMSDTRSREILMDDNFAQASQSLSAWAGAVSSDLVAGTRMTRLASVNAQVPLSTVREETSEATFTTVHGVKNRSLRWKWCTEKDCDSQNVVITAPSTKFEDYTRIDVRAAYKDVSGLLKKYKVTMDNEAIQDILWHLLVSECYFMTSPDSKLLFMMEHVVMCFSHEDRFLVEKKGSADKDMVLPSLAKIRGESPQIAGQRFWTAYLQMPPDAANFIEDGVEKTEREDEYPGLRTVHRNHLIIVDLLAEDPTVLKTIGLPGYENFSSRSGTQSHETLSFSWLTMESCVEKGLKLGEKRTNRLFKQARLCSADNEDADDLKAFLTEYGVDTSKWTGEKETQTVDDLLNELRDGECCFLDDGNKGVQRVLCVVTLRLWTPDDKYLLLQVGAKGASGYESKSLLLPGSTQRVRETIHECAQRVLTEQLGLHENDTVFQSETLWQYDESERETSKYPGLMTRYQKFFVDVRLGDERSVLEKMRVIDGDHRDSDT